MIKRMAVMLVLIGVVFGGIFGFQAFKSKMIRKYMSAAQPPQTVSATKVAFEQWQTEERAVGTLRAVRGADLAPEVAGIVQAIHFKSGEQVKAGTPLLQLNADADVASLKSLEAAAALAENTYRRDTEQFKVKAVSQATLDADAAAVKSTKAQVEAAAGAGGEEADPRALRRPRRHPRGRPRPVSESGNEDRDAAGARPGVRRFPRAAGHCSSATPWARRWSLTRRRLPRPEIRGPRLGARLQGGSGDAQRQSARDGAQPETAAAAGHVRNGGDRARRPRSAC